jgi:AcrR family transcriptional regulator
MNDNDNSVNIKKRNPRYHHGDLRSALIEEGLKRLESGPAEKVSLREIARNVGVSATAVYRHFPDKAALLSALCLAGDDMLAEAFTAAIEGEPDGRAAFRAVGRAYVRFGIANPALFQLMYAPLPDGREGEGTDFQSKAMQILRDGIAGLSEPGTSEADRNVKGLQAWSLVHGLAVLMLSRFVPADDALIDLVVDNFSV